MTDWYGPSAFKRQPTWMTVLKLKLRVWRARLTGDSGYHVDWHKYDRHQEWKRIDRRDWWGQIR